MMNQKQIGRYIAEKRRIKNLTQAQLAEQLGISDKTVSKWECGRSMPDYALIQSLCETLDISVSELIEGKEASLHERQLMELLRRTQELERQNGILHAHIRHCLAGPCTAFRWLADAGSALRHHPGSICRHPSPRHIFDLSGHAETLIQLLVSS